MNGNTPASTRRGFRLAALTAAVICVLALAAAAFVLSYPGARDTARIAGVTPHLARIYPVIFDAVLVVACAAAVTLRGVLRACAWLAILVVIGTVAAADAVHAMSVALPKRPIEATVAIVPWAVLLIGFTLLYAMAWQAWPGRRTAAARAAANGRASAADQPGTTAKPAGTSVPLSSLLADKPAESGTTTAAAPAAAGDIPAASKTPAATSEVPAAGGEATAAASDSPAAAVATLPESPLPSRRAPERDDPSDADAAPVDPSGAHFNRLRSTPTPPED